MSVRRSNSLDLFQSTPVIADERMEAWWVDSVRRWQFQSTPVIADERMRGSLDGKPIQDCFNPRPSLLTSEWFFGKARALLKFVSIHARHC